MSRSWADCAICRDNFMVDYDADPIDVCSTCTSRVAAVVTVAVRAEHKRIADAIAAAADESVGGPAQLAMELIAKAIRGEQ